MVASSASLRLTQTYPGPAMPFVITDVDISAAMVAKINSKHGITVEDVEDACYGGVLGGSWHDDPRRGTRLLIRGVTESGRILRIVLYPIDVQRGWYRLGTAIVDSK